MKTIPFVSILLLLFIAFPVSAQSNPMNIFVSIEPQKWLAQKIGGQAVQIHVLVASGQDPHSFEPSPKQLMKLSGAALFFRVGLPFEDSILHKISRSAAGVTFIDTSAGVDKIRMASTNHDEGHHENHNHHSGLDPHIWLSPINLQIMAKTMANAMIQADPGNKNMYEKNLDNTFSSLANLDKKISSQLTPFRGRTFYVFHPAFGYFAKQYHLVQKAVEVEGKSPTPKQLSSLIAMARKENVQVIFVQPQFDPKSANAIARAIHGTVVPLNPLATDVGANLQNMADNMEKALN